ncbi:MAG: glycosyltransferase family 1 protein, partial [Pirellulales bacterium]
MKKPRVLLDLSRAARGYCGVAQDVRLLYKTLASCPELDVTGLIYLPRRLRPLHRFLPTGARLSDRIANQACFLWEFDEKNDPWPRNGLLRACQHLWQLASTVLSTRVDLDPLEVDTFWDPVWRLLFSPTLSVDDVSLVRGGKFLLSNLSDGMVQSRVLLRRRTLKLDTRGFDYFIGQDVRPLRLSPETRHVLRYHDLIPVIRPDTMANPWYIKWHHRAIRQHSNKTIFVCNSDPTRDDLTAAYPELCERCVTIPHMLTDRYHPDARREMVARIIDRRRNSASGEPHSSVAGPCDRYLMCVSTLEPRKNYPMLMQAFNMLKDRLGGSGPLVDLKLIIVGNLGWKYAPIVEAMRPLTRRGELVHLENVPVEELRILYAHASAFVFPSNYEGFGFPPLEAMQCGTPVIASDIAAHRWVLGDAALYCSPYDARSLADVAERLLVSDESAALAKTLVERGQQRVKLYDAEHCSAKWLDLLLGAKRQANGGNWCP